MNVDIPLSAQQRQMWLLDRLGASHNHRITRRILITGTLDVSAMERALTAVTEAHDVLRARVSWIGDEPTITFAEPHRIPIEVFDQPIGPDEDPRPLANRLGEQIRTKPLSLEHGPLLAAHLYRLRPGLELFIVVFHHFAVDGFSLPPFWTGVATAYAAAIADEPVHVPRPHRQYHEWASEQRAALESGTLDDDLDWWESTLWDAPPLQLPGGDQHADGRSHRQGKKVLLLPTSFPAQIRSAADTIGTTRTQVVLGVYVLFLSRITGQTDFVIGMPANARTHSDDHDVIGYFVNLLPLRIKVPRVRSLRAAALAVAAVANDASRHRHVPFLAILDRIRPHRAPDAPPLVQTEFNYTQHFSRAPTLEGLNCELVAQGPGGTAFDLALYVSTTDAPRMTMTWETDVVPMENILAWLSLLESMTSAALDNVDLDLDAIRLLSGNTPLAVAGSRQLGHALFRDRGSLPIGVADGQGVVHGHGFGELAVRDERSEHSLPTGLMAVAERGRFRVLGAAPECAEVDGRLVDLADMAQRIRNEPAIAAAEVRLIDGRITAVVVPAEQTDEASATAATEAAAAQAVDAPAGIDIDVRIVARIPLIETLVQPTP